MGYKEFLTGGERMGKKGISLRKAGRRRSLLVSLLPIAIMILSVVISAVPLSIGTPGEGDASSMTSTLANDPGAVQVALKELDNGDIILDLYIPAVEEEELQVASETFQVLTIPGYDCTQEVGKPQLPVIRETVGIPVGASVRATILDATYSYREGYMVYPVQEPELDTEEEYEFVIDREFYSQDAFYPAEIVAVGTPAVWRDVSVVSVQVNPVMFNPASGALRVYDHIQVQLEFSGGVAVPKTVEPKFAQMYHSTLLNYDQLDIAEEYGEYQDGAAAASIMVEPDGVERDGTPVTTSVKLLSIRPQTTIPFNDVKPFLDWHKKRGLPYVSYGLPEPVTASGVKSLINSVYSYHPELEYVLLVGDIDLIPWYANWGGGSSATGDDLPGDYWYACLSGGATPDLYPEVAVGRLSVNTVAELQQQTTKIITYSDSPPAGSWVDRVLLVAHQEYAPGKYQGCKEDIRTASYSDSFTFDTAYGAATPTGDGATNTDVVNAIVAGRGIVNYRGHGGHGDPASRPWGTQWGGQYSSGAPAPWNADGEQVTTTTAHSPLNGDMTPVLFSISCLNMALDNPSGECLAEAFVKDDDSAVAFLGATRGSYTTPNHEFDKDLFDAIGNEGIYNIGWILNDANTELLNRYGTGSIYVNNTKIYLWLGDPSLELWTGTPLSFVVTYPSTVSNAITVSVTNQKGANVANALVCLTKGDPIYPDVYVYGYTNALGLATFSFTPTSSGPMTVTVTKHNYRPHQGTTTVDIAAPSVTVVSPNGGEVWKIGSLHDITWAATDKVAAVTGIDIKYSVDGGATYPFTIATGEADDGLYHWTIPNTPSRKCRVKVIAHDNAGLTGEDVSNANFIIAKPNIWVKPPSFDLTLPPNTIWSGLLRTGNSGYETLIFNITDSETTCGPYFTWVAQSPDPLPAYHGGLIKAKVQDPDGLADIEYVRLWVTRNPFDAAYLYDDGTHGDETAGDGIYTQVIFGTTMYGGEVALLLEAKDLAGNTGHVSHTVHIDVGDVDEDAAVEYMKGLLNPEVEIVEDKPDNQSETGITVSGRDGAGTEVHGLQTDTAYAAESPYLVAVAAASYPNTRETDALHETLTELGLSYVDVNSVVEAEAADAEVIIAYVGSVRFNLTTLDNFIKNGGGYIQIGDWTEWFANDYESIGEGNSVTVTISDSTHPVTSGLPGSWTARGYWSYGYNADDYVGWVTDTAKPNIAVLQATNYSAHSRGVSAVMQGAGRAVYIGFNVYGNLTSSNDKLLFRNALQWVATPDCPWLDANPKSGAVASETHTDITVTINTTGLTLGNYSAELFIASNDPDMNPTIVPVQVTVKPPVAGGRVLFDETHAPSCGGPECFTLEELYQDWANLLRCWGFTVESVTAGTITYDLLKDYCVVVIPEPTVNYTEPEILALQLYVNNGGGLLILSEWGPFAQSSGMFPIVNELATPFNMSFNADVIFDSMQHDGVNYWPLIPNFESSVVGADVLRVVEYAGCTIALNGSAFPIAWARSPGFTMDLEVTDILADAHGTGVEPGESLLTKAASNATDGYTVQTSEASQEQLTTSAGVEIAPGSSIVTADDSFGPPALAVIETGSCISSSVNKALDELGYTYDFYQTSNFSGIDFSLYDAVVVGADGGSIKEDPSVVALATFVSNGGKLIFLGGSNSQSFVDGVDNHLLDVDTINRSWTMVAATPHLQVTEFAHPLASGLLEHDFTNPAATYYMLRITDPAIDIVAENGDGYPALIAKQQGSGIMIWFINSPYDMYWSDTNDYNILKTILKNSLEYGMIKAVMAASLNGAGKAMVIGDGNLFTASDPDGDGISSLFEYDNEKLAVNIMDWLCGLPTIYFDTGTGTYPSIAGIHNGTITPSCNLTVSRLYTYASPGTGGHTEYVRIWNETETLVEETWIGYQGEWQYLLFSKSVTLRRNERYNYTIITGSYPLMHHTAALPIATGWINCSSFTDVNGKEYDRGIPAIRLE